LEKGTKNEEDIRCLPRFLLVYEVDSANFASYFAKINDYFAEPIGYFAKISFILPKTVIIPPITI
jgi:hypothetical protein